MLRSLVLILLIVNATFFAWSQGWLNKLLGVQPDAQHEPQRMALQAHVDKIVVVPPVAAYDAPARATPVPVPVPVPVVKPAEPAASAASSPVSSASVPASAAATQAASGKEGGLCVEAGPFNATEYASAETTLRPLLPAGSWANQAVAIQGLWLLYMGPYADADMLERKQIELRRIKGLNFEEVRTPANLAQGLSLGRFTKEEDAQAALATLRNRGIRTARVVNIRPSMEVQIIRVARASEAMQVALAGIKLPQGKGFTACRP
jgi:cell division septation protein DedD